MNTYLSAVNEKLFFASLLLAQLKQAGENRHLEKALGQSVVYQLAQGYRHHLREIAANYQCRAPEAIADSDQLTRALMDVEKWPAEAQEMKNLEEDPESWLNEIMATLASFDRIEAGDGPRMEREGVIPVQEAPRATLPPLTADSASRWLEGLQELVERHRNVMFEC